MKILLLAQDIDLFTYIMNYLDTILLNTKLKLIVLNVVLL